MLNKQSKRPAENTKKSKPEKKAKLDISFDENKTDVAVVFIGDMAQAFELTVEKNKKSLRDSIKKSCSTWNTHVCFIHQDLKIQADCEPAKLVIPKISDIQKTMPIVTMVFLPSYETNIAAYTAFLTELLTQVQPMVTIGSMPTLIDDLWQKDATALTTYHTMMTNIYTVFMTTCPRISVINLSQPAEFRPKVSVQSFIDRLSGRIRPLIPTSKDIKTAINQAATAAAKGNLDFGTADDVQKFNNIKKAIAKEKKVNKNATATQQVQLRSQNSQQ